MNKFILLPIDIYKGLLQVSENIGNNIEFARREVEKAKNERTDPSTKNIHLSQVLRRFLHLKKEQEEKPVRITDVTPTVEGPAAANFGAAPSPPQQIPRPFPPAPPSPSPLQQVTPSPQLNLPLQLLPPPQVPANEPVIVQQQDYEPSPTIRRPRTRTQKRTASAKPYFRGGKRAIGHQRRKTTLDIGGNEIQPTEAASIEAQPSPTLPLGSRVPAGPSPKIRRQPATKPHKQPSGSPYFRKSGGKKSLGVREPIGEEESDWLSEDEDDEEAGLPSTSTQQPSAVSADAQSAVQRQLYRLSEEELFAKPIGELTREQLAWRYHRFFNRNPDRFGVSGDVILNDQGQPIPKSSLNFSLIYIIDRSAGRNPPNQKQPPGTKFIERRINSDTVLKSWMSLRRKGTKRKAAESEVTKKPPFRPKIWKPK